MFRERIFLRDCSASCWEGESIATDLKIERRRKKKKRKWIGERERKWVSEHIFEEVERNQLSILGERKKKKSVWGKKPFQKGSYFSAEKGREGGRKVSSFASMDG